MNKILSKRMLILLCIVLSIALVYMLFRTNTLTHKLMTNASEVTKVQSQLQKLINENTALKTSNDTLTRTLSTLNNTPTNFHIKKLTPNQYTDMNVYSIKGNVYQAPFDFSQSIENIELNCFVLGHVVNELNEEWVYIELLNVMDATFKYGYTKPTNLHYDATQHYPLDIDSIRVNDISFLDTLDTLQAKFGEDTLPVIDGEDWSVHTDDTYVLIHPHSSIVEGILLREEGQSFDGIIHVGDNALDGIKYYTSIYPTYFDESTFLEPPMNWFALSEDGLVLVLDYDTSLPIEDSHLTEIKIIKMLDS